MLVFALGASRNIGRFATLRLLAKGATVVYLLRSVATLENDPEFKPHIDSGKAKFIKGDAMSYDDVSAAWKVAISEGTVGLILFTVGATGGSFSITKGFVMNPPNLCSVSIVNVIRSALVTNSPTPKLVVLSSTALTRTSKAAAPFLIKILYSSLLELPHADKRGLEAAVFQGLGKPYEKDETPGDDILPAGWRDQIPEGCFAKHANGGGCVVIRAALLTDGAEKGRYRAEPGDFGAWRVSRRDVGHFVAEDLLENWSKFEGGVVTIGY